MCFYAICNGLSIEFDYNLDDWYDYDYWRPRLLGEKPKTPQRVLEFESSVAWRALISKTFYALTKNKSPNFKHLEIRQLHCDNVSTFSTTAFHEFLNHFEQLTHSTHGVENSRGYKSYLIQDYRALMGKLDEFFFGHLANITILSIKALKEGQLKLPVEDYVPLALKADQMPLLANLHLDDFFASTDLIDFLVSHKDTLEELILCNCYASVQTMLKTAFTGTSPSTPSSLSTLLNSVVLNWLEAACACLTKQFSSRKDTRNFAPYISRIRRG